MIINFKVMTLDSQTHELSVDDGITIKELKEIIAEKISIAADQQRIIHLGQLLDNDKQLKTFNINEKVLHVVERPPPLSGAQASATTTRTSIENSMNFRSSMSLERIREYLLEAYEIGAELDRSFSETFPRVVGVVASSRNFVEVEIVDLVENNETQNNEVPDTTTGDANESSVNNAIVDAEEDAAQPSTSTDESNAAATSSSANDARNPTVSVVDIMHTLQSNQAQDLVETSQDSISAETLHQNWIEVPDADIQLETIVTDDDNESSFTNTSTIGSDEIAVESEDTTTPPKISQDEGTSAAGPSAISPNSNTDDDQLEDIIICDTDESSISNTSITPPQASSPSTSSDVEVLLCSSDSMESTTVELPQNSNVPPEDIVTVETSESSSEEELEEDNPCTATDAAARTTVMARRLRRHILGNIVERMRDTQHVLNPFIDRYSALLQDDTIFEDNDNTSPRNALRIIDGVTRAFPFLARAQVAIANLMTNNNPSEELFPNVSVSTSPPARPTTTYRHIITFYPSRHTRIPRSRLPPMVLRQGPRRIAIRPDSMQAELISFATARLFHGSPISQDGMLPAADIAVQYLNDILVFLPQFDMEVYNSRASVEALLRFNIISIINVVNDSMAEIVVHFEHFLGIEFNTLFGRLFKMLVVCVGDNADLYWSQFKSFLLFEIRKHFKGETLRFLSEQIQNLNSPSSVQIEDIKRFLVYKKKPTPNDDETPSGSSSASTSRHINITTATPQSTNEMQSELTADSSEASVSEVVKTKHVGKGLTGEALRKAIQAIRDKYEASASSTQNVDQTANETPTNSSLESSNSEDNRPSGVKKRIKSSSDSKKDDAPHTSKYFKKDD